MSQPLFYIQESNTRGDGDTILWWRANRCGYTTRLEDAGKYTLAEARDIESTRGTDKAFPVESIEAVSTRVVRAENLPMKATLP